MLILNQETISPQRFCEMFKIDLDKLKKNTLFELSKKFVKKDKANGNVDKIPPLISYPASFFFKDSDGETHELRYATTYNPNRVIDGNVVAKYEPYYVFIESLKFSFNDIDKTLFMYCRPEQLHSPFRNKNKKEYDFEHIDHAKRAAHKLENLSGIGKAMDHARSLKEEELMLLAKGIKHTYKSFNPFSAGENTDSDTLRVNLMEFAHLNASKYLEMVDSKTVSLKGRIINLVDNKIIELRKYQGGTVGQWEWSKGEREGQVIGDQIIGNKIDAKDYLVTYIMNNLEHYYNLLHTVNENISAENKAIDFLKKVQKNNPVDETQVSNDRVPKGYQECFKWLGDNGMKKSTAIAKKLADAVEDGLIHNENIFGFVENLFQEAEEDRAI